MSQSEQIKCQNCKKYVWPDYRDSTGSTFKGGSQLGFLGNIILGLFFGIDFIFMVWFNLATFIYIAIGLLILFVLLITFGKPSIKKTIETQTLYPTCPKCKSEIYDL